MSSSCFKVRKPENETILTYNEGSCERNNLKSKISELKQKYFEIPLIIGGKEIYTGKTQKCVIPYNKNHVLATYPRVIKETFNAPSDYRYSFMK